MVNLGCGSRAHADWINIDYSFAARAKWIPIVGRRLPSLPPGYRNWNLRNGIPLPTDSADIVYASHVLEHVDHHAAPAFLSEVRRVLRSGGVIRLVVPDLETAARNYLVALDHVRSNEGDENASDEHELATIVLLDQMVRRELGGELSRWLRSHAGSKTVLKKGGIFSAIAESRPALEQRGRFVNLFARVLGLADPERRGEVHRWMYDEVSLTALLRQLGFRDVARVTADKSRVDKWARFGLDTDESGFPHHPDSLWIEAIK